MRKSKFILYFIKTPFIAQRLFPKIIWKGPKTSNSVYLTFDDGPSEYTNWLLDVLAEQNIKATFFCLGRQIEKFPVAFDRIITEGHQIGNHTFAHLDGWKTNKEMYVNDINKMQSIYKTDLFRPPFGRLKPSQYQVVQHDFKIVMWNRMPGDFNPNISISRLEQNIREAIKSQNLIVLHDQKTAYHNLKNILPNILKDKSTLSYSTEF